MSSWDVYHTGITLDQGHGGIPAHDFLLFAVLITWNRKDAEIEMEYSELRKEVRRRLINAGASPIIGYAFDKEAFDNYFQYPWITQSGKETYHITIDGFCDYMKANDWYVFGQYTEGALKRAFNI